MEYDYTLIKLFKVKEERTVRYMKVNNIYVQNRMIEFPEKKNRYLSNRQQAYSQKIPHARKYISQDVVGHPIITNNPRNSVT